MTDQRKPHFHASAPFGALGRRLGWRWVFPIGTMPVPWHPLLAPLLAAGLAAWLLVRPLWRAIEAGSVGPLAASWTTPLLVAALLGLLLSAPLLHGSSTWCGCTWCRRLWCRSPWRCWRCMR